MIREIVWIDEEKCDGCGLCVPACEEGAIRIVNGKAKLVADRLCDGLGACLGHCPKGAIRIDQREAEEFDEHAVQAHLAASPPPARPEPTHGPLVAPHAAKVASHGGSPCAGSLAGAHASAGHGHAHGAGGGCPSQRFARLGGAASQSRQTGEPPVGAADERAAPSELSQWPVQLRLLPPRAPLFQDADLLLAADCVPFALPDFHSRLLRRRAVAIACPKLDDTSTYVAKLTEIITANRIRSIVVAHMEVPCCTGILMMALQARAASGVDVPVEDVVIGVRGEILRRRLVPVEATV